MYLINAGLKRSKLLAKKKDILESSLKVDKSGFEPKFISR